uniref:restriction endonuclease subunit S n=1 Tax=Arthrobacter sp. TaxID=1667 RepID=UPI000EB7397C|nr:restriction endonuclease subunit S [Arthrobacter sp.]AXV46721.1 type I restriction modification DNA specificity domain protein [Arthrobacter sp.]
MGGVRKRSSDPRADETYPASKATQWSGKWAWYSLEQLFEIEKGTRLTKRDQLSGLTPYIGSSALRNGVTNRISKEPDFPGHVLTVPYNGSVGHAFYQPIPFCAGDDVHVLHPRKAIDKFALLFVATVIRHEKYRFTYGRKWHLGRMRKSTVRLPSTTDGEPDWPYMSRFMQGLNFSAAIEDQRERYVGV